ncbi:MAG: hypothetical protein IPF53_22705, partial [Blastocatellia bacterium]|nr:hypothetical protein [Blastocatellia bacterium]
MSAYYQRQDLRHYVSTDVETSYGVQTAHARISKEFMLAREVIAETIKRTPYNLCGGEFHSIYTDEQKDAAAAISLFATPDAAGWLQYYLSGGGAAYGVSGVGDPYTHTFKPIQSPDYRADSFTMVEGWKGGSEFYSYRGGLITQGRIRGSIDGDKRVQIEANAEFAGERELLVGFTPPSCVGEEVYRTPDATLTFAEFGGSAYSGLTMRSFEFSVDNRPETLDEVQRSGQYIVSRDRGDRSDSFRCRLSILGKKGDAVDTAFHDGDFVKVTLALPNKTASRVWTI